MRTEIVPTPEFPANSLVADTIASTESQTAFFNDGIDVLPSGMLALTVLAGALLVRKAVHSDRPWSDSIRDFFADK